MKSFREQVTNSTVSTRIGGMSEEEEISKHDNRNMGNNGGQRKKKQDGNEDDSQGDKNNDELSTIVSPSQCSTCVSYVCKVCGENVHRGGGQTSTAGAETCYSCSIYEGNQSVLGSEISSCNSDCSSKASLVNGWKKSSERNRHNYSSSEDCGSIRSRRSVQIIRTDSESSLSDPASDDDCTLDALDSPQTGKNLHSPTSSSMISFGCVMLKFSFIFFLFDFSMETKS